jgi:hypothetical protein
MIDSQVQTAEHELLEAAHAGRLAQFMAADRRRADAALYALVSGIVYQHLTRPLELKRGHYRCAADPGRLEPECRDGHQDEVEAARAYVLAHAHERFENLCGWLASRLAYVSVDAHRRRRAQSGALQRPRLPKWLTDRIGRDRWLQELAVKILNWVGVPTTAGYEVWPLAAWAEQRAASTGLPEISEARMQAEVDSILAAMRTRPGWYADYVERPLGRKHAPLIPAQRTSAQEVREPRYVRYDEPDDAQEALLTELASTAIAAIAELAARGTPVRDAVAEVLGTVFGADDGVHEQDLLPGDGRAPSPRERAARLALEPEVLDRVVDATLRIIAPRAGAGAGAGAER